MERDALVDDRVLEAKAGPADVFLAPVAELDDEVAVLVGDVALAEADVGEEHALQLGPDVLLHAAVARPDHAAFAVLCGERSGSDGETGG